MNVTQREYIGNNRCGWDSDEVHVACEVSVDAVGSRPIRHTFRDCEPQAVDPLEVHISGVLQINRPMAGKDHRVTRST